MHCWLDAQQIWTVASAWLGAPTGLLGHHVIWAHPPWGSIWQRPNFLWLPVQNSSLWAGLPNLPNYLKEESPFSSIHPSIAPFSQLCLFSLRLNPNRSLPPLQLCPLSTSSHTKTSGPRELTSFPNLPELSPQPHSQLVHQELLSPIQYQSKRLPPLLLHPARTQPEANKRTAQICIFTFYSLQLLGHDSEQTS